MKIRRLTIHGFGLFNEGKELTFSEDKINVVAGDNEAGKTTLVAALYGIIFGFAKADEERRHRPWADCERYAAEVEIAVGARAFRITRDFDTNHCSIAAVEGELERELFEGGANPRGRVDQRYGKVLDEIIGVSNGAVAAKTSLIRQLEMQTDIDAEVRRLVSGARRGDFQGVLEALQAQYADLTRSNPWGSRDRQNDRAIELAEKDVAELRARRDELRAHLDRVAALEIDIERMQAKGKELAQARQDDEALLERVNRLTDGQRKIKDLEQRIEEIRREKDKIDAAKKRLLEIQQEMATRFDGFADLGEDFAQRLRDLASARAEVAAAEAHAAEQAAKAEQLSQEIASLEKGIRDEFGEFVDLSNEFPQQLAAFREKEQRLHSVRSRAAEIRQQLARLESDIQKDSPRFGQMDESFPDKVRTLQAEQKRVADLRVKQARERESRLEDERVRGEMQERIESEFGPFVQAGPNLRGSLIELSERRAEMLRVEHARLAAEDRLGTAETRHRRTRYGHVGGAVVGALAGVCIGLLVDKGPAVQFSLAVIAGVMGWMAVSYVLGSTRKELLELSAETQELSDDAQNTRNAVDALSAELGILSEFSALQDQLDKLDQYGQLVRQRTALDERIASYADAAELEEEIAAVHAEVTRLAEELSPAMKGDDDLDGLIDEFDAFQSRCRDAEACRRTLAAVLEQDPANPEDKGIVDKLEVDIEKLKPSLRGFESMPDREEVVKRFREYQALGEKLREKQSIFDNITEKGGHEARVDAARDRLRACEQSMGLPVDSQTDLDALGERYGQYQELKQQQAVNEAVLTQSTDEEKLASDEASAFAQYGAAERGVATLLSDAPYLRGLMDDPIGMGRESEQARRRLGDLAQEESALASELRQKEIERRALETQGAGDLHDLDSKIEELGSDLSRMRVRAAALQLAVDTLSEVVRDYQAEHATRIARAASEIFSIVTNGRYPEVTLDDEFVPSPLARRGDEPISEESLSCGTRDQLYLSLRVAVARELAQRVALPFIMDDPFVHFDDARVEAARRVLGVIRTCHQVVILTHDKRCLTWEDVNVVRL